MYTHQHVVLSVVVTQYGTLERVSDGLYKASNMTSHLGAARFCIYVTQTLICDTFMVGMSFRNPSIVSDFRHACQIYRAFVIWERQWKIIALPLILLILDASKYTNVPLPPRTDSPTSVSGYISTTPKGDNLTMMILFPCASFLTNSLSTGTSHGALRIWLFANHTNLKQLSSCGAYCPGAPTQYRWRVSRCIAESSQLSCNPPRCTLSRLSPSWSPSA